jgi:hypothetical protein
VKNIESRLRIIVPEMCDTIITRIKKDSFLLTNKPFPSSIKVDSENITNPYYQNSISQQYDVESKNIYYTFNFPSHFSVAFLLLISPKAMRKLMSYCIALGTDYSKFEIKEGGNSGEEFENLSNFPVNTRCSIKCSSVSRYEQIISEILRVPFTSSFYIQSSAFGTKSGAKRIFAAADVNTFPSVYDIYDPMLLPAAIARLASRNVPLSSSSRGSATRSTTSETFSQRVIIKIDDEVRGRGHAVIEIGNFVKNALNSLSLSFQDVVLSPAVFFFFFFLIFYLLNN